MKGSGSMITNDQEDRRRLVERINAEMVAIINSPSTNVEKFRFGILAKLGGELKTVNDRIRRKANANQYERVS
ncbi:hypothetical protein OXB_3014 [Bacillus sp. OxB-1]|uniref:hypothetical protein n=1 Tax=Bacillus sp. (strain OxB-1) TaxID=98228 RepID=UPI000581CBC3|nr:hypothetical protein [Bacillus sp. OxB-1]BAQ11484.1 hypothetical protein OXB_3014 [Bacillus sp. OxB-1]